MQLHPVQIIPFEANKSGGVSHWNRDQLGEAEFSKMCTPFWGSGGMALRKILNFISSNMLFQCRCYLYNTVDIHPAARHYFFVIFIWHFLCTHVRAYIVFRLRHIRQEQLGESSLYPKNLVTMTPWKFKYCYSWRKFCSCQPSRHGF